jgi:hypothetical protein
MNRLMLCSGITKREGWKTLDSNPAHNPDILASIPPLPAEVCAVQWDEIELIHGITSFYPWEAKQLLIEIRDVLAPGGKLVLEQPNLDYVVAALATGAGLVEWLFGDAQFENPAHMNKWAFSPRGLRDLLQFLGYARVEFHTAQHHNPVRDFRIEAYV